MADVQVKQKKYPRFTLFQRIEHLILTLAFTTLALTGLPQKYATEDWARTMINLLGGIETIRIIHRTMATLLMAEAIYHGGVISYKLFVLGRRVTMLPTLRDLRDVIDWVKYNLGLSSRHPRMPRFNFGEKAEYLAVIWGTVIMAITGFMMWNPIATASLLPGTWIPAARAAHGAEALLAVLAILTWHFYNVLIKRFNQSIFTGKLSHEAMVEEHAEELEEIEQGIQPTHVPDQVIARRKRFFLPYAVVMSLILVGGLIWFISFEETAITTVSRLAEAGGVSISVSPEIGDPQQGAALWPELDCGTCHGEQGEGIPDMSSIPLVGTNISFEAFVASVRRGPADMPAYPSDVVSDETLAHLWAWLSQDIDE